MSRRSLSRAPVVIALVFASAAAFSCTDANRGGVATDGSKADVARMEMSPAPPVFSAPIADQAATDQLRGAVGGTALSREPNAAGAGRAPLERPARASASALPASQAQSGAMLIRMGQASVEVDSLELGLARVREMARRTGATIANTVMQGGREQVRSASLELRIPSDRFDEAINGLAPIGKLESVNVSVQDVGEEYVDIEARVANARRLEQRLIELLANRTGKLSDVLSVERELARVREEIERFEGRLRYLRTRSSVSTLTVGVHEPYPIVAQRPGEHPLRDAFVQAWRNLVGVTAAAIASLGVIIPLGLIALVIILLGRRLLNGRTLRLGPEKPAEVKGA